MLPSISLEELLNAVQKPSANLELHRLELLRSHCPELHQALLSLNFEYQLLIVCKAQEEAEAVVRAICLIAAQAWLTLGCLDVSVWLNNKRLKRCVTHSPLAELESDATAFEENSMATATLEKTAAGQMNGATVEASADRVYYPLEAIAKNLAAYTQQDVQSTINIILESKPDLRFEDGTYKAPASAGREAFRLWAAQMEAQLASGLLPEVSDAPIAQPENPAPKARKATAKKTTAKKPTAKKTPARRTRKQPEPTAQADS